MGCVQLGPRKLSVIRSSGMSAIQGLPQVEVNGRTVGTFRIVPGVRYHGALACLVRNSLVYKTRSVDTAS